MANYRVENTTFELNFHSTNTHTCIYACVYFREGSDEIDKNAEPPVVAYMLLNDDVVEVIVYIRPHKNNCVFVAHSSSYLPSFAREKPYI